MACQIEFIAYGVLHVISLTQLDEIRRASRYPKLQAVLQPAKVEAMINNLQRAIVLERLTIEHEEDDPDDAFLLAMASAGDADYLITGDRRTGLLQWGHIGRTRIVTPAIFVPRCYNPSQIFEFITSNLPNASLWLSVRFRTVGHQPPQPSQTRKY